MVDPDVEVDPLDLLNPEDREVLEAEQLCDEIGELSVHLASHFAQWNS